MPLSERAREWSSAADLGREAGEDRFDRGQRGLQARRELQDVGGGEPGAGRILVAAAGGERVAGREPGGEGPLGAAAQGEHAADRVLRLRDPLDLAPASPAIDRLAPGARGCGEIARELRADGEPLEQLEADEIRASGQVEGALVQLRGIAVGPHALRCGRRFAERRAGTLDVARPEPVRGPFGRRRPGSVQRAGDRRVQRAAARPRDRLVHRIAHERVPELQMAGPGLDEEPGLQCLGERLGARRRDVLDSEALAHHGRALEGVAGVERERLGAQEHGIEHRLRERKAPGLRASALQGERRRELLDVERNALGAVVQGGDDVLVELVARHGGREPRRVGEVERPQRKLHEVALPSQLRAQAAEPVHVGRHLVPRHRDQQDRHVPQPAREHREQCQGRLVGPVQVVEHDGRGPV